MAVAARLADRCAIVTGAGWGIGAAVAGRFAEERARVACLDIDANAADATASEIGGGAIGIEVDVADEAAVQSVVRSVIGAFDRLDIVCNAAAIAGPQSPVTETPTDEWDRTFEVNLRGTFLVAKHTLSVLSESRGNIVNIASAMAFTGSRRESAYGPTSAGIVQLTQAMALDYAPDVRVNCVCPGPTRRPMTNRLTDGAPGVDAALAEAGEMNSLDRGWVEPSEIADGILFLASEDASYMTGAALPVDGGFLAS